MHLTSLEHKPKGEPILSFNRTLLLCRLALQDLWHDRIISFCIASSLVAVIAPLLLLFGLRFGIVSQLQDDLANDPRNLEIRMLSSGSYDQAWIAQLRQRPDVGFAIGQATPGFLVGTGVGVLAAVLVWLKDRR